MLNMKAQQRDAQIREEKDMEKFIADRNRNDYEKYLQAANERKRWQSNMLSQDYGAAMNMKMQAKEQERMAEREQGVMNTLPGVASGANYALQM